MAELTLSQIKENRRKWVEALRSGKYKQGADYLKDGTGAMCCLGVLADIAGCEWTHRGKNYADDSWSYAPQRAMAFVGLTTKSANYAVNDGGLANDNDGGMSFADIADIIESEPEGMFIPDDVLASRLRAQA